MVVGGVASVIVGRIIHRGYHSLDSNDNKFAKEGYDGIERRAVMAMLVHWCYYRDLNPLEVAAAWFLEYDNERAKTYGDECWEPHPCQATESKLKELGLAFLRRKASHSNPNAPDLVIVLRGTIPTRLTDLAADWKIGIQQFDHTDRVVRISELTLQVVEKFRRENPGKQICMAGHSLGAAIALIVGGCLHCSTRKIDIDTHLFNPPLLTLVDVARGFPTATPLDPHCCHMEINFSKLKEALVLDKAAVNREWERFVCLKDWVPHMYLNPGDPICRQYIAFYKSREGQPVRSSADLISTQGVVSGLFLTGLFNEKVDYLKNVVPSAHLSISTWSAKPKGIAKLAPGPLKVFAGRLPHSLRQWHKYTKDYIDLKEHQARLLQQPHESFDTVSPRIPDYSYLTQ